MLCNMTLDHIACNMTLDHIACQYLLASCCQYLLASCCQYLLELQSRLGFTAHRHSYGKQDA